MRGCPKPLRWLLLAVAALVLTALAACGKPSVAMEGVVVYQSQSGGFYLYTEGRSDKVYSIVGEAPVSGGELEVGQRVSVKYDGYIYLIAPPFLGEVYSIDVLGPAEDGDLQTALDYFNTEIKPWHLPNE